MSDRKLKDGSQAEIKTEPEALKQGPEPAPPESNLSKLTNGLHPSTRRVLSITAVSIIGPLLAVSFGLYLYLSGGRYVSTDNAYIKSEKIAVSPDISGRVSAVFVNANQVVKPGEVLFRIDPEPFQIAVDQARAGLIAARQEGEALKSLYRQKVAEIERAKVDLQFLERRFTRQSQLKSKAIASQSTFETADQNLQSARMQLGALEQDKAQVIAKLGGNLDTPIANLPGVMTAAAALRSAELNLRRTEVRASLDGIVTNFDLQQGEYVEEGKAVFSIVGTRELWVQANYRETDLSNMRVGQSATIRVDAYPSEERTAHIESIDPATGAEFALLPPQNATGNWVKVVQRLPVRLRLDEPLRDPPLRAGMSAVVTVDTKHERSLGGLMDWIWTKIGG
jgi:membrane fusion protein (multidrug efflux system)